MKALLFFAVIAICPLIRAEIVTESVSYEHAGVKLEGFLARDRAVSSSSKRPGVLVVPEWWGLTDYPKSRARQLAEMGYVAFVADMYGEGKTTTDAKEAQALAGPFFGKPLMAERARAGLDRFLKMEFVDSARVAAIGFCFGGSACQALAFSGAPVAGIVSFHGGLVKPAADAAPGLRAKLLILNGAIDPMVKRQDVTDFITALDERHIDYQFIDYAGALHAFSNPGATTLAEKNGMTAAVGYNEKAAVRSWAHMKLFFDEILSSK